MARSKNTKKRCPCCGLSVETIAGIKVLSDSRQHFIVDEEGPITAVTEQGVRRGRWEFKIRGAVPAWVPHD